MSRTSHRLDSDDNEPEAGYESRHPKRTLIQPTTPEDDTTDEEDEDEWVDDILDGN
jgi:hypothetical protein